MPEAAPEEERRRPEEFLAEANRASRGRLKVYLGMAAGVGKTYRMMQEARALRHEGVDVVVGAFESHGRASTAALVEGMERIPPLQVEHRGIALEEFDLAAALARKPRLILMDELAHTNAPGLPNPKRWQDVLALLEAGIDVHSTVNVQHIESLNDIIERATGIRVQETVPDRMLAEVASEVVNVDIPVEELLERLRAGKVYPQHRIQTAMRNFFQEDKLHALRELALRETAKDVAVQAKRSLEDMRPHDRLAVGLPRDLDNARKLVRVAARLAGKHNTEWAVVHVETPRDNVAQRTIGQSQALEDVLDLARTLGAEVVRLEGKDAVDPLLAYARSKRVGQIVVGRPRRKGLRGLWGSDDLQGLLERSGPIDIHIVNFDAAEDATG